METLQLTKYQARQALYTYEWAKEELKNKDIKYLEYQAKTYNEKYDNITCIDGIYHYIRKSEGTTYDFIIDTKTVTPLDSLKINNEEVSIYYLQGFLGDLTPEEQEMGLKCLYIEDMEKYLCNITGTEIKLKSLLTYKKGTHQLDLYTDDLRDKSGVCKAMLKNIYIESRGNGYYIDKYDGEQHLNTFIFYFRYEHQDGGSNGHEIGRVRWNTKTNEFEGYNYETGKYEAI